MRFQKDKIVAFVQHFNELREQVRNQPGCHSLQLLQDEQDPRIFFTYSTWAQQSDLDTYRKSDFFASVWKETKQMFEGKPEAWSVQEIPTTQY